MGYYTSIQGQITISPPLTWREIKGSPFVVLAADLLPARDCKLRVVQEERDTDEGTLISKYADAIVCSYDDQIKAYTIEAHLQELLDLHGEGHTFSGHLDAEGEEAGDLWRLAVRDGRAVRIEPRIVWPDEAEESAR
jgi:hypothetical protein